MAIDLDDRGRALENEYFHRKEQELIEKMKSRIGTADARNTEVKCPKCDGTLHETNYESIKIDLCGKCGGVWLDTGELAQIAHHEENKGSWFGKVFG